MNIVNELLKGIKDFIVAILNVLLMGVTFGRKSIQKTFSIQAYEMKVEKLKTDKQKAEIANLEIMKTAKKAELELKRLKSELQDTEKKMELAAVREDINTGNDLVKKYNSLKNQIENNNIVLLSTNNNIALMNKSIDLLASQVTSEQINIQELKNKEQTSKTINDVNSLVKSIQIGSVDGLDMKSLSESIENDFIDSKVENEILLEKFPSKENTSNSEFSTIAELNEFLNKIKEPNKSE